MGALIIAGLMMSVPAFYVNWGRYAQLTGQAILPAMLWLIWDTLDPDGRSPKNTSAIISTLLLTAIILTGMVLTYYRMAFYSITFVIALVAVYGVADRSTFIQHWKGWLVKLAVIGVGALILFIPWGLRISDSSLSEVALGAGSAENFPSALLNDYQGWLNLSQYLPTVIVWLIVIGIAFAVARRKWILLTPVLWVLLLAAVPALAVLGIPGTNLMQSFAILIFLYIPAGLITGALIGELCDLVLRRFKTMGLLLISIAFLLTAFWGTWGQANIAQPGAFALVTNPDNRAFDWIRENTPDTSKFLVEGFRIYNGRSAVGSDAGWWLPLFTQRANTMPPQYAMLNEEPLQPGYSQEITNLIESLEKFPPESAEVTNRLCKMGVTHVYIGQAQGRVSSTHGPQLFSPADFSDSDLFKRIYHQDRVYVFELLPEACD
jgi:hypothetical protein